MQVKHSRIYSKYRKQFCYLSFCHTDIIVHHSSEFLRYISGKYLPADPSLENEIFMLVQLIELCENREYFY